VTVITVPASITVSVVVVIAASLVQDRKLHVVLILIFEIFLVSAR
jgi:hypothetical protein